MNTSSAFEWRLPMNIWVIRKFCWLCPQFRQDELNSGLPTASRTFILGILKYFFKVWKFGNFLGTLILREINFGSVQDDKTAILTISEALKTFYQTCIIVPNWFHEKYYSFSVINLIWRCFAIASNNEKNSWNQFDTFMRVGLIDGFSSEINFLHQCVKSSSYLQFCKYAA